MIRVLLVEDNAADARLAYEMLKEGDPWRYHITRVACLAEALHRLEGEKFDVVLLDLALPDSYGSTALDALLAAAPVVPVVVLTGLQDESFALQTVQRGAQDFLAKGSSDADQLARSIRYAITRRRRLGDARPGG